MFQFTLPRGERPARAWRACPIPCFNSRSRGGSDLWSVQNCSFLRVSIHAPAGGATSAAVQDVKTTWFQFTLPRGERHDGLANCTISRCVSIHAPAGGATFLPSRPSSLGMFQFTLPRGERLWNQWFRDQNLQFQFTLPRGERLDRRQGFPRAKGFNSRSRGGSDKNFLWIKLSCTCFNSRSRGGSDTERSIEARGIIEFQFTLPRGERPNRLLWSNWQKMFQFTLPRGERRQHPTIR